MRHFSNYFKELHIHGRELAREKLYNLLDQAGLLHLMDIKPWDIYSDFIDESKELASAVFSRHFPLGNHS
jgi:hypothetical protein